MSLRVKLLHPNAKLPARSHTAAAFDLSCVENGVLAPGYRTIIDTGVAIEIPLGYYGKICDRSGLAAREGITVLAGVIDNDYRGELKVILLNTSTSTVMYTAGDRMAQIVFMEYGDFGVVQVDELRETERGSAGLGSTGK